MLIATSVMATITGTTRVFYCIADPIDQVRAPEVFNAVFARADVDAVMVPLCVHPERLESTLRALLESPSVGGVSLSIPHKAAATTVVDHRSDIATISGAVNAVRRNATGALEGDLFDGLGFTGLLQRAAIDHVGRRVLIIGAGGAASAVATALADEGVPTIVLYDPDVEKARQLAQRLRARFDIEAFAASTSDPSGFDLIVNASPLGLKDSDPLPIDIAAIPAHAAVCDILMKNQPTPLLRRARARGLVAEPGFDMLIRQTPHYLDFFGYPELAEMVRRDDLFLRQLLFLESLTPARIDATLDTSREVLFSV